VKRAAAGSAASWILRIKVGDRRPDLGLGPYPTVTLEQARARGREVHEQVRAGVDPLAARKAAREALRTAQGRRMTFMEAARQCHAMKAPGFRNVKHRNDWINSITSHVSPHIGAMQVADVQVADVLRVLNPIWLHKTETATRVRQRLEDIFAWATVSGYREGPNPAAWEGNLEYTLARPSRLRKVAHHEALPWAEVPAFMQRLRAREGMGARALEFAILTAARSGEVRGARWGEIDLDAKIWTVPAHRMKADKTHRVPLSDAAIALLVALPRIEGCALVFPGIGCRPLSDMFGDDDPDRLTTTILAG